MTAPSNLRARRIPSPTEVAAASALTTLGVVPLGQVPASVSEEVDAEELDRTRRTYALGAMGGAAVGGAVIGWASAGDFRGFATGSLITFGLAGIGNGVHLVRKTDSRMLGGALGFVGLVGVGAALFLSSRREDA